MDDIILNNFTRYLDNIKYLFIFKKYFTNHKYGIFIQNKFYIINLYKCYILS